MRPRVARVESFPLEAPLPDGGYGASMVRLAARVATLVKITTSDGVAGWGESFGPPRVLASLLAELAGPLVGQPVDVREPFLLEFDRGHNPLREGVLATPLTFADSTVDVPPGPGLGIEVDEDAVRGHELADYHLDSMR